MWFDRACLRLWYGVKWAESIKQVSATNSNCVVQIQHSMARRIGRADKLLCLWAAFIGVSAICLDSIPLRSALSRANMFAASIRIQALLSASATKARERVHTSPESFVTMFSDRQRDALPNSLPHFGRGPIKQHETMGWSWWQLMDNVPNLSGRTAAYTLFHVQWDEQGDTRASDCPANATWNS